MPANPSITIDTDTAAVTLHPGVYVLHEPWGPFTLRNDTSMCGARIPSRACVAGW